MTRDTLEVQRCLTLEVYRCQTEKVPKTLPRSFAITLLGT